MALEVLVHQTLVKMILRGLDDRMVTPTLSVREMLISVVRFGPKPQIRRWHMSARMRSISTNFFSGSSSSVGTRISALAAFRYVQMDVHKRRFAERPGMVDGDTIMCCVWRKNCSATISTGNVQLNIVIDFRRVRRQEFLRRPARIR